MEKTILISILLSIYPIVLGGFTEGEPCHELNTALLNPTRPVWPRIKVHCVDARNMGNSSWMPYLNKIKNTTTIFADSMHLKKIPMKLISALPRLELLDVTNNSIKRIHPKTFLYNDNFETLLLANNRIRFFKVRPMIISDSLKTLYLTKNYIKSIPVMAFTRLPALKVLFLDSNELTAVNPKVFVPLQNLKMLHLGNNLITRIPPKNSLPRSLVTYITKSNPRETQLKRRKRD